MDQAGVYGTQGVAAPENTPGAPDGAVSWTGLDGVLYLFGGYDFWCYDTGTNQWTWLKGPCSSRVYGTQGVSAPGNTPGKRDGAVSWTGSDGALYLFGGYDLNDLWRYAQPQLDLAVSVSAESDARVGNNIFYSIKVRNNGCYSAHDVTLDTSLPPELQFVEASASRGTVTRGSDGNVVTRIGTLPGDDTVTIAVTLGATSEGVFSLEAFAGCVEEDPNTSNNLAVVSTRTSTGSGPDLQATLSGIKVSTRKSRARTAWQIRGTLAVSNTGDQVADKGTAQIFLSDAPTIPQGLSPVTTVKCARIRAGAVSRKSLSVTLPAGVTPTGKYLIAVVDSANTVAEANEFNNQAVFPLP